MTNPIRNFYFEGHVRAVALPVITAIDEQRRLAGCGPDYDRATEVYVTAALSFGRLALAVDEDLEDKYKERSLEPARSGLYDGTLVMVSERRRSGTGLVMVALSPHPDETRMWPFPSLMMRVPETNVVYGSAADLPVCPHCGARQYVGRSCAACDFGGDTVRPR